MARYNNCTFAGHLASDAEQRVLDSGDSLVKFRIGVSSFKKDGETLWMSCAWFGSRAEKVCQHLTKGKPVLVNGELQVPRIFQSTSGENRVALEIRVNDVQMLSSREDSEARTNGGGNGGAKRERTQQPARQPAQEEPHNDFPNDEDIPF